MPQTNSTRRQQAGYEWPLWIVPFYFWQIIVLVVCECYVFSALVLTMCIGGCGVAPGDPLLIDVFLNLFILIGTIFETVRCSRDTLTINVFLGFQTAKCLYSTWILYIVFGVSSAGPPIRVVDLILTIILYFGLLGSPFVGVMWGIVLKIKERNKGLRDEERPLLVEGQPGGASASQDITALPSQNHVAS